MGMGTTISYDKSAILAATLQHLDVHFVVLDAEHEVAPLDSPKYLISGLASNSEARMRLALIPLFLRHPDYSAYVSLVKGLTNSQTQALHCFYMAAHLLQQKYRSELVTTFGDFADLPNLFEEELKLGPVDCPDQQLRQLAQRQATLSQKPLNWYGTYEHAYIRLVRHANLQKKWLS